MKNIAKSILSLNPEYLKIEIPRMVLYFKVDKIYQTTYYKEYALEVHIDESEVIKIEISEEGVITLTDQYSLWFTYISDSWIEKNQQVVTVLTKEEYEEKTKEFKNALKIGKELQSIKNKRKST